MLMLITLSPQEDHIDGIDHGASCSLTAAQHMLMADAFIKKSPKKGEARPQNMPPHLSAFLQSVNRWLQ